MFGLSTSHLLIVAFVVLLFGARRLPVLGASLGQGLRAFKGALDGKPVPPAPGPEKIESKQA